MIDKKIINYINDIHIIILDEDYDELVKRDVIFENTYDFIKKSLELFEKDKKIPRCLVDEISKEYASYFGHCKDSEEFMKNFCNFVAYKENFSFFEQKKEIKENFLSKIADFVTAYEPISFATLAEKLEWRKIWKGLLNEFLRKFIEDEYKTIENAKAFLVLKNFHPDFVETVFSSFIKEKGLTKTQQKKYTGKETILYIEDLFKKIASETLKRGGLKYVNKKNYSLSNDPFVKPKKIIPKETNNNLEQQKKKILIDIKNLINKKPVDRKTLKDLIDKFINLEKDKNIIKKFKMLKKKL